MRTWHNTRVVIPDVSGSFDAACWPSVLMTHKYFISTTNIYNQTNIYLCQRTAVMSTNILSVEKVVSNVCRQGSCFEKGVWNVQYNSVLNLEFRKQIKTIAFADESLVSVKTESVREAENNTNLGVNKISIWAKNKKIKINEHKSKVMAESRRKWKEKNEVTVYMKCKL